MNIEVFTKALRALEFQFQFPFQGCYDEKPLKEIICGLHDLRRGGPGARIVISAKSLEVGEWDFNRYIEMLQKAGFSPCVLKRNGESVNMTIEYNEVKNVK